MNARGILEVRFRSSYSTASGVATKEVNKEEIDVYCVYCPQTDCCYYFNPKLFSKSISLRVDSPKNKQEKKVNFASDYREIPWKHLKRYGVFFNLSLKSYNSVR